jgi:hypothetical protein
MQRSPDASGLDRKFGALYDKIYREDVLWVAWKKVRANKGAPGVDQQRFEYIEEVLGVEAFLREIEEEIHSQKYRPQAVRRCWIDKPGKPEKRPLGIPTIYPNIIWNFITWKVHSFFLAIAKRFIPCASAAIFMFLPNGLLPKREMSSSLSL